jgi:hypothetical protein
MTITLPLLRLNRGSGKMNDINNKVLVVSVEDINAIKKKLISDNKTLLVELNGSTIQSWEEYISEIQEKFRFPTPCFDSVDRYLDWMRDLGWLDKEKYTLVINNFSLFLQDKPELKKNIISDFTEIILPFWQEEVEEVVVGGKAKSFMVYLVE